MKIKRIINPKVKSTVKTSEMGRTSFGTIFLLLFFIGPRIFVSIIVIGMFNIKARQKPTITGARIFSNLDQTRVTTERFWETVKITIAKVIIPRIVFIFFFVNSIFSPQDSKLSKKIRINTIIIIIYKLTCKFKRLYQVNKKEMREKTLISLVVLYKIKEGHRKGECF